MRRTDKLGELFSELGAGQEKGLDRFARPGYNNKQLYIPLKGKEGKSTSSVRAQRAQAAVNG